MQEQDYYLEIENYIKRKEVNAKRIVLEENYDTLNIYWNIGKLLVEAQGGSNRAKYGNELIKKWSIKYTKNYGKNYSERSLRRFRQFYIEFPNWSPLETISWSHIKEVISIKDINKRNYYLNLCVTKNFSKRQLIEEIKSNSYERLLNKP